MRLTLSAGTTLWILAFSNIALQAQSWQMPPETERCPSKWGAGDQRGAANLMNPETILRAAKLIKTGEIFELGAVLSTDPKESFINGNRVFNIYTKPALPIPNARVENEELVVTELGQIGTQFDAFAHQMWGDSFYNCFKLGDIGTRAGFKKLGVENVRHSDKPRRVDRRRRLEGRRAAAGFVHYYTRRSPTGAGQSQSKIAAR